MPVGSDSSLIEVDPLDNGSIIAQALSSNLYKEALIKNNYLDFTSKSKQMIHPQNSSDTLGGDYLSVMKLFHKDDIFNYEYSPQTIETELLSGE